MGRRRYTEKQFRDAVADPTVTTIADLCRRLGLVPRGGNYASLRALGHRLNVDLDGVLAQRESQVRPGRWQRPWTPQQLREALLRPDVTTMRELCHALGVAPRTKAYRRIERVVADLGLDSSHIAPPPVGRGPIGLGVPDDLLRDLVARAATRDDVLHALGLEISRNNRRRLARAIARLDIGTGHLATSAGPPDSRTRGRRSRQRLDQVLRADTDVTSSSLRRRLLEEGLLPRRCNRCARTQWEGSPVPLELDHVDGDRRNNRLDNLRLLCPNCHALTPTYRGRNIGRRAGSRGGTGVRGRAGIGDTGTA